ncbi:MAG: FIST signal transduction protein [Gammaproteobacteria bacterium]
MQIESFSYRDGAWSGMPSAMDSSNTLLVVFGGARFLDEPGPIAELHAAFPQSLLMGCSSAGEISGVEVNDDSLSVAAVRFESSRIRLASAVLDDADRSAEAGAELARALRDEGLKGVFVLSEGLSVNGTELVRGINANLAENVVVTGGLAGDGARFERTWVIHDGRPVSGRAVAVGFYGDRVQIGHGSKGGWDIFGPQRQVTRSEGNVLFELDGKPALGLYKDYLGELADELPASGLRFPLALRDAADAERELVRTILAVDEETQSMTFAGDIPQGAYAQLMRANFDHLVDGAEEAALMTRAASGDGPMLAIAISCVGRRMVLGERTEDEVEATLDIFPEGTHQIGFYSYGELSPYASGSCDLHNQTMTLTTVRETL